MTAAAPNLRQRNVAQRQYATFYVGSMLLGVDIREVQEINRQPEITSVPHAPNHVCGVINLRGEVVTVIDLRTVLGMPRGEVTRESRNLIVHSRGEAISLLVDRMADIVSISPDEVCATPANLNGIAGRFFHGVCPTESEIIVLLDVEQALADAGVQDSAESQARTL